MEGEVISATDKDHEKLDVSKIRINSYAEDGFNSNIPFIQISFKGISRPLTFMCDSGAEVNLIKLSAITHNLLPIPIKLQIAGMCGGKGDTVGMVKLKIGNHFAIFHVMNDRIATFKSDGILGSEFFWEDGIDLLYSQNRLKVGDYSFEFLPRDKIKKVSKYWIDRARNEVLGKNTWEDAEMEALTPSQVGGVLNISPEEKTNVHVCSDAPQIPMTECHTMSQPSLVNEIEVSEKDIYSKSYCDLRMEAYLNEMNFMESSNGTGLYDKHKSILPNYYQDVNFQQTILRENGSRLEKILELANLQNLDKKEYSSIFKILEDYIDVPYLKGDAWKGTDLLTHRIRLNTDKPINVKKHRIPYKLTDTVNQQIEEWLKMGIIRPSTSPYNSPIWVVPKKCDSHGNPRWRVVTDFRKLNEHTEMDEYPLPNLLSIFDRIGGAKYYTKLDLSSGFLHIPVAPEDISKTAISTDNGSFEFLKMPFGMKTAPKTFQRAMDIALKGLIGCGVFVYMDDIIIYAKTLAEHNRILSEVLARLRKHNFKLEVDKCEFLKKEVTYLGHVLGPNGVKVDPEKIRAVKEFPTPKNQKNVRQFLGLSGFYRRFVKDYAKIARPLFDLLKKDAIFHWTTSCKQSFEFLKNELCKSPILVFPDFGKEYLLFTDASKDAIGGLLAQGTIKKNNPIAYWSRALKGAEQNYSTYEKEALAIADAIKHFRQYLYASKFTVITDHKPLLTMLEAENNGRVQRMRLKLQGYDMKIVHTPGKENLSADALSRNPVLSEALAVTRSKTKPHDQRQLTKNKDRSIGPNTKERRKRGRPKKLTLQPANKKACPPGENRVQKKRGRPPKQRTLSQEGEEEIELEKDNPYSSGEESDIEEEQTQDKNIVKSKELFEYRKDNLIYFVDTDGNPLDEGAKRLSMIRRRPIKEKYEEGLYSLKRNKKYLFELGIDTAKAGHLILQDIENLMKDIMKTVNDRKLRSLSISKSENIGTVSWDSIYKLLRENFNKEVKIIICENQLKYVPIENRDKIFDELHSSPQGGHRGILKSYMRIKKSYYWENLRKDVRDRVNRCIKCNLNKVKKRTKTEMCITDTPHRSFDKIAMDIVGPYPKTSTGNEYVLTIQDLLTKYVVLIPLPNQTAETVSDAFIKRYISYFACPRVLLTDLGTNFKSNLFRQLAKRFRIKKVFTTAARPQSNSSLERSHGSLHDFLRHYIDDKTEWDNMIEFASLCYNTSIHESTKFSPYELVFGFEAREPSVEPTIKDDSYGDYFKKLLINLKNIQEKAHDNLVATKHRTKLYYDKKINPNELKIGNKVFKLIFGNKKKLHPYEEGPFIVVDIDYVNKNAWIKHKKGKLKKVHLDFLRLSRS